LLKTLDSQTLAFRDDVLAGLAAPIPAIPARWLYDHRGSELFDEITRLPSYYPTRTETKLLDDIMADIAERVPPAAAVVEFGAGSATKTPVLLDAVKAETFVAIDISGEFLVQALDELAGARPGLRVVPVQGDFTQPLTLPPLPRPLIGFFSGSTIGNFGHLTAVNLLRSFRETLGEGALLVIGIDTRKNPHLLEAAYDDAAGVTGEFNLNMLGRINRELGGTIPVDAFEHRAVWHDGYGRIEMHLVATRDLSFDAAGQRFAMAAGETIHTENSYKYTLAEARVMARASGWEPLAYWTDPEELFGLHVWTAASEAGQP